MPTASLLGASKSKSNGNSPRTPTATGKERQAGAQGSKDKGECKTTKAISPKGRMFIGLLAERAGVGLHDTGDEIHKKLAPMKDQDLRDGKFDGLSLSHIAVIDEIDVTIHVQRDGRDERGKFSAFGLMKATMDYRATLS